MPKVRASLPVTIGMAIGLPLWPALAQTVPTLPEGGASIATSAEGAS